MDRRKFISLFFKFVALFTAGCKSIKGKGKANGFAKYAQDIFDKNCFTPKNEEEETLMALVDTIIPGSKNDPTGAPGAPETCAMKILYSDINPISETMSTVTNLLNSQSRKLFGDSFINLDLKERTEVALAIEQELPIISLLYKFIRGAFYTSEYTDLGEKYMGYPGSNTGYINHPNFTYGEGLKNFIKEETKDGNLP